MLEAQDEMPARPHRAQRRLGTNAVEGEEPLLRRHRGPLGGPADHHKTTRSDLHAWKPTPSEAAKRSL